MGEVRNFPNILANRFNEVRTQRNLAIAGAVGGSVAAFLFGNSFGQSQERGRQILEVPKACFSFDKMQNGHLDIMLQGNADRVMFTVNGQVIDEYDLGTVQSKEGPVFEMLGCEAGPPK